LPNKPYHEVQSQIKEADLLLLPSLKEGLANVVLEAMALGTLVLSTDCGGMSEVIKNGVNGFVVPIRDIKALADKIVEISKLDAYEAEQLRYNAHQTIMKRHTQEQMVQEMIELYNEVLK
jgi:colanic acid/amylovoran biosynthesis glycosyltransferase